MVQLAPPIVTNASINPLLASSDLKMKVHFLGIATETLMLGIFLVLLPQAIYVTLRYPKAVPLRSISHFNKTVLVVFGILFCSITAHWTLSSATLYFAFFRRSTEGVDSLLLASEYLADIANPLNCGRVILLHSQILCQDFVLIYRMFIVWGRNKHVIILPTIGFCLTVGLIFPLVSKLGAANGSRVDSVTYAVITATYLSTLFTTVYSSFMIGWKIWKSNRSLREIKQDSVKPLPFLLIVIESAGLYSLAIISGLTTYLIDTGVLFAAQNITGSFIGTSLCLMVLRVKIIRGRHQFSGDSIHTLRFRPNVSGNVESSHMPSSPTVTEIDIDEEERRKGVMECVE